MQRCWCFALRLSSNALACCAGGCRLGLVLLLLRRCSPPRSCSSCLPREACSSPPAFSSRRFYAARHCRARLSRTRSSPTPPALARESLELARRVACVVLPDVLADVVVCVTDEVLELFVEPPMARRAAHWPGLAGWLPGCCSPCGTTAARGQNSTVLWGCNCGYAVTPRLSLYIYIYT